MMFCGMHVFFFHKDPSQGPHEGHQILVGRDKLLDPKAVRLWRFKKYMINTLNAVLKVWTCCRKILHGPFTALFLPRKLPLGKQTRKSGVMSGSAMTICNPSHIKYPTIVVHVMCLRQFSKPQHPQQISTKKMAWLCRMENPGPFHLELLQPTLRIIWRQIRNRKNLGLELEQRVSCHLHRGRCIGVATCCYMLLPSRPARPAHSTCWRCLCTSTCAWWQQ